MLSQVLYWYGEASYTDGEFVWRVFAHSIGCKHAYTLTMTNKHTNKWIKRCFDSLASVETAMLRYGAPITEGWHY